MAKFYFTYGSNSKNQDYVGGWTEVEADSAREALDVYRYYHPGRDGVLPCCGVAYTKEEMARPYKYGTRAGESMLTEGNFGKFCHDRIVMRREVLK